MLSKMQAVDGADLESGDSAPDFAQRGRNVQTRRVRRNFCAHAEEPRFPRGFVVI